MKVCANVLFAFAMVIATRSAIAASVTFLDDGEKVARETSHPLPPSVWPSGTPVALLAMRGETIAFQAIVTGDANDEEELRAMVSSLRSASGVVLDADVQTYGERFVPIVRASHEAKGTASLAFTAAAAPLVGTFLGSFADALVPGDTSVKSGERAAMWIDVAISIEAKPGTYEGAVTLASHRGAIETRALVLRVLDAALPYAAAKTMIYYEQKTLETRTGGRNAERDLRFLLHADHLSAIRDVHTAEDMALDEDALSGRLYTADGGYRGPGLGIGDGVFAIGAYGSLGAPSEASIGTAATLRALALMSANGAPLDVFLYAVDEECESRLPREWRGALAQASTPLPVAATCKRDPGEQAADLVMQTPEDLAPERKRTKPVWAYNGRRPFAGAMVLDVPATDLRANAWIAARYEIPRWFYWESTYWGAFDPFNVAETFHDKDGDVSNGDGILLYPGAAVGRDGVLPSIRLNNLRRGVEDAGYIALARAIDPKATDAIVRRMIPRALADANPDDPPAWPARGAEWLSARVELAAILQHERIGDAFLVRVPPEPRAMLHSKRASDRGNAWGLAGVFLGALLGSALGLIGYRSPKPFFGQEKTAAPETPSKP